MTESPRPGQADQFATRLRAAVDASGLGLEQIQRRLHRLGHQVSLATLSYWRSGRSVPSQRSVPTVEGLERVLEVRPGAFTDLLTGAPGAPPDASSSPAASALGGLDVPPAFADLVTRTTTGVAMVSDHLTYVVGPDRRCVAARSRRVYRALVDDVDRLLVGTHLPDGVDAGSPGARAISGCRTGAVTVLADRRTSLTELVLDRRLGRGDPIMLELGLDRSSAATTGTPREVAVVGPLRELVIEARFDHVARPAAYEWYEPGDGSGESITPLALDTTGSVLVLRHDVAPGHCGVRWSWDPLRER